MAELMNAIQNTFFQMAVIVCFVFWRVNKQYQEMLNDMFDRNKRLEEIINSQRKQIEQLINPKPATVIDINKNTNGKEDKKSLIPS